MLLLTIFSVYSYESLLKHNTTDLIKMLQSFYNTINYINRFCLKMQTENPYSLQKIHKILFIMFVILLSNLYTYKYK